MMILRYSDLSPFVRKVHVFADEAGVLDLIKREPADVWSQDSDIYKDNPLGKVPALITPHGVFLGSFACCDYLARRYGGIWLLPESEPARWRVMQLHGLADGVMEASVAYAIEALRRPADYVYPAYLERQLDKIARGLRAADNRASEFREIDLASITMGCALGYLDLRLRAQIDWRSHAPQLAMWYGEFSNRPSMRKTESQK